MPQMSECENCGTKFNPQVSLRCPSCFWGTGFSISRPRKVEVKKEEPEITIKINLPDNKKEIRAEIYGYLVSQGFKFTTERRKELKKLLQKLCDSAPK